MVESPMIVSDMLPCHSDGVIFPEAWSVGEMSEEHEPPDTPQVRS